MKAAKSAAKTAAATPVVVDASAILALLQTERGWHAVAEIRPRAQISAVNLTEVLTRLIDKGHPAALAHSIVATLGLKTVSVDADLAIRAAGLRAVTRSLGMSLGDRICIALAQRLNVPVYTADRAWAGLDIGIEIQMIR